MPFEREPFDVDEVIEEVVRDANFEGAAKGCNVETVGAAHSVVNGNRELLRSAIENVLRNAVRYSPQGASRGGRGRTRRGGTHDVGTRSGPGVPESELERIFEPFYRVAESRDRDTGGEGIGLAITSQVMRAHGGTARADNRAGGGFEVSSACRSQRWRRDGRMMSLYQEACGTSRAASTRRCAHFAASAASRSSSSKPPARTSWPPTAAASSTTSAPGGR